MRRYYSILLFLAPLLSLTFIGEGPGDGILNLAKIDKDKIFLLIDKSNYRLYLYEDTKLLKTYKVVFGSNNLRDKQMQGDKETPEGTFHIIDKRYHNRWSRFILLDYPNEASRKKFQLQKSRGLIPQNAKIGGGIGIHGTPAGVKLGVDLRVNWTDGCIGMKNDAVDELFKIVEVGTPVVIKR